jgi:hypothetical protein
MLKVAKTLRLSGHHLQVGASWRNMYDDAFPFIDPVRLGMALMAGFLIGLTICGRSARRHFQPYFGKPWSLQMTSSIPEPRPPSPRQRSASKRVPDDTSLLRRARNRSASPARWAVRSRQIARSIRNGKNQRLCARDRVPRPSTLTNSGAQIERSYRGLLHHENRTGLSPLSRLVRKRGRSALAASGPHGNSVTKRLERAFTAQCESAMRGLGIAL